MSRQIRLKFSYNGTRWIGGPEWPPYNGVMEVSDEEAAQLVSIGNAVYLEDEPEPIHQGWAPLNEYADSYDPALEAAETRKEDPELTEYAEEEEAEVSGPKRPYTNAKKEVWIAYALAVDDEANEEVLSRMSRVDIISKYGASI